MAHFSTEVPVCLGHESGRTNLKIGTDLNDQNVGDTNATTNSRFMSDYGLNGGRSAAAGVMFVCSWKHGGLEILFQCQISMYRAEKKYWYVVV